MKKSKHLGAVQACPPDSNPINHITVYWVLMTLYPYHGANYDILRNIFHIHGLCEDLLCTVRIYLNFI